VSLQNYAEILFRDEVRRLQEDQGIADKYAAAYERRTEPELREEEKRFIEERESFYMASVSSTGWPYVQHRGGPKGFLKVLGPTRLGFADYSGNRQLITMGHVALDDRVALILMDYMNRVRYKLLGHLAMEPVEDADPAIVESLSTEGQGTVERIALLEVVAIDRNCPQYIPQLFGVDVVRSILQSETAELQAENARLREELARLGRTGETP
jgi:predicted pyridoxine 5'-phosphate oxidase superfamily flavin-nucleotide-binding protein